MASKGMDFKAIRGEWADELMALLTDLEVDAQTNALIALAGGFVIEAEAKKRCPVDTGYLRNSIHTEVGDASRTEATAITGTNTEYATHVEFGTKKMAARSYLRAAFDETIDTAVKQMSTTAAKLIGKIWGKV